jgi:hypothetical protein
MTGGEWCLEQQYRDGATQCGADPSIVMSCQPEGTCYKWKIKTTCTAPQLCGDVVGGFDCVCPPPDEERFCDAEAAARGDTKCSLDFGSVEVCQSVGGCYEWVLQTSCDPAGTGMRCFQ